MKKHGFSLADLPLAETPKTAPACSPGPWKYDRNMWIWAPASGVDNGCPFARVAGIVCDDLLPLSDVQKQVTANGFMMAAARVMYDVLSEAVEMYERSRFPSDVDIGRWLHSARAALLAAEGKA